MKKSETNDSFGTTSPRRPRGRPRVFNRDEALGLATRLFWLKGYERTSIADLTDAMGIEPPSLYSAFGSKKELYGAALQHYGEKYEGFVWDKFRAAATARDAAEAYLMDSAAALTGSLADVPRGCMATLSAVDGEGLAELGNLLRATRAVVFDRLKARLKRAVKDGELSSSVDVASLARFVQNTQSGMSILARDGAARKELELVARIAILGWDSFISEREKKRPER
jgi:AcrR family transcriptional regulator